MDIDGEDSEETQRAKNVADYGLEVNFESLEQAEQEVRSSSPCLLLGSSNTLQFYLRTEATKPNKDY